MVVISRLYKNKLIFDSKDASHKLVWHKICSAILPTKVYWTLEKQSNDNTPVFKKKDEKKKKILLTVPDLIFLHQ